MVFKQSEAGAFGSKGLTVHALASLFETLAVFEYEQKKR